MTEQAALTAGTQTKLTPEEKLQARLERAQQPSSVVVSPHTPQGNANADMFYSFDKGLNAVRMAAGMYVPVADVNGYLQTVVALQEGAIKIIEVYGGGKFDIDEFGPFEENNYFKQALAAQRGSRVLLPRTKEIRQMARILNALDPLIMRWRESMDDVEKSKGFFEAVVRFLADFHEITKTLCEAANKSSSTDTRRRKISYRPPRIVQDIIEKTNAGNGDYFEEAAGS